MDSSISELRFFFFLFLWLKFYIENLITISTMKEHSKLGVKFSNILAQLHVNFKWINMSNFR